MTAGGFLLPQTHPCKFMHRGNVVMHRGSFYAFHAVFIRPVSKASIRPSFGQESASISTSRINRCGSKLSTGGLPRSNL